MPPEPAAPPSPAGAIPVAPTEEEWRAMSQAERDRLLETILDVLSDPRAAMSEGRPHKKAKTRTLDVLGLHFGALGRIVYLAEEMAVLYPGKEVFTPDVLAVLDVPEPEDDQRMAWVVADEGKGLDLVIEILHRGDRKKDLTDNVERYADLGIPEYFVYDRAQQAIRGYRLPAPVTMGAPAPKPPGAKRYVPILAQGGRYRSAVLGLDLAVEDDTLRFYQGMSELIGSGELIRRLTAMIDARGAKADQAAAEAEQANARAEKAAAEAEQANARAEQANARAEHAVAGLCASILTVLAARGLTVSDALRDRLRACDDPDTLQRWLLRALEASQAEDVTVA